MSLAEGNGLFALGIPPEQFNLPHPRLDLPVILLVRRVLLFAFDLLRERGFALVTAKEDEVTAALRAIIENDLRQTGKVAGFGRLTYETVVRQGQVINFDLTKLTKTPDLCFKLRNDEEEPRQVLSEHEALFVECKPVDETHAVGGRYCDDGLCRFVEGDYAWAMQEGLMLGYARHGRTIAEHLIPVMEEAVRRMKLKTVKAPQEIKHPGAVACEHAEALHVSRHNRGFAWVANKGPATDIFIYHSWHDCG